MALIRDTSTAQLAFQIAEGQPDDFLVLRYRGTEGLCQLYRFEIELSTTLEAVEFDDAVGKAAILSINTSSGTRYFHGIVARFEMTGHTTDQLYFRAELVPNVWLLTHRYNSRIFQEQTVPDIIAAVMEAGGIPSDRMNFALSGDHPVRPYCVQYRETDYNFICRLMEEEGIWWYFEHTEEHCTFIAADNASSYANIEGDPILPYQPPTGLATEAEHVFRFRMGQCVRPGAVGLSDYNFENPKLKLEALSDAGRDTALEFYDYPGEYGTQADGATLAQLRNEEFMSGRIHGVGQSNSYRLTPGRKFELSGHKCESFDREYLITSMLHQGKSGTTRSSSGSNGRSSILNAQTHQALLNAQRSDDTNVKELAGGLIEVVEKLQLGDPTAHRTLTQWLFHAGQVSRDLASNAGVLGTNPLEALTVPNLLEDIRQVSIVDFDAPLYECRFECIPAEVAYRPPRVSPWPVMRGTQTALVVGPEGEEIYTDKYGRIKVQFHWDRLGQYNDKSSCWIRVAQGWAGSGWGMMFIPRIGHEVIVDFLEGDPDKPIVTGCVYNADNMPPYNLPDEKTKSVIKSNSSTGGDGHNEIRIEDKKGKEQLYIHAERNEDIRVKCDVKETIGNDRHLIVARDRLEKIDRDSHLQIAERRIEATAGDAHCTVGGDSFSEVLGDTHIIVGGDQAEKVGGDDNLAVGGNRNESAGSKISIEAGTDIHEKAGMNMAHEAGMEIHLKGGMNVVVEAGMQLTLKGPGGFITIGPTGVDISGMMVKINSGGSAGSGAGCSPTGPASPDLPELPEDPVAADTSESGEVEELPEATPHDDAAVLQQAAVKGAPFYCVECEENADEELDSAVGDTGE